MYVCMDTYVRGLLQHFRGPKVVANGLAGIRNVPSFSINVEHGSF